MTWMSELKEFYEIILRCGGGIFTLIAVNQEAQTITVKHDGGITTIDVPNIELTNRFSFDSPTETFTLIEFLKEELSRTRKIRGFDVLFKISLIFDTIGIEVFTIKNSIYTPIRRHYFHVY